MSRKWMESMKEHIWEGIFLGMVFLTVTLLTAALSNERGLWGQCRGYILPIAVICFVVGILINSWHRRRSRKDFVNYGASGLYKIDNLSWVILFVIILVQTLLPNGILSILIANLAVLVLIWLGEYLYLKYIAKKLNGTRGIIKESTMLVLKEKPKNVDAFFDCFVKYCGENNKNYEIMEKDIPGTVRIDGIEYQLKLVEDYSMFGIPDYYMVLTTGPSETQD